MGNVVVWKPASTAMLERLLPDAALPGGGPAGRRDQPRLRLRRRDRRRGAREPGSRRASTSPARPASSTGCGRRSPSNIGALPQLPAHRRRDGRQGLHRRPPVGRPRRASRRRSSAARSSTRARSARRPRASTPRRTSGRRCASGWPSEVATIKMGDVADFGNFMGAVIDASSFATQREAIEEARASTTAPRSSPAAATTTRRATSSSRRVIETTRPGLPPDARGALRPGRDRVRLRREALGRDARPRSTPAPPYALTGAVFAEDRAAIAGGVATACATRPATSTSTTSRPAPSSASSRSAARAPRARTTRRARSGT